LPIRALLRLANECRFSVTPRGLGTGLAGGTMAGEHGVGIAKQRFLPLELSPESIRLQRAIKLLFDPNLILNPGKVFT
jgi:FAD/FMN-containing dehydrogenase